MIAVYILSIATITIASVATISKLRRDLAAAHLRIDELHAALGISLRHELDRAPIIVSREIISEPGSAIEVIRLRLSRTKGVES